MRIATWNVNSIRARMERIHRWVAAEKPDVVCMQELKCQDAEFPSEAFQALGYEVATHGQKTYNGVAILSLKPLADLARGFGDGGDDSQSRVIAATVDGIRVVNVYVPNGQAPGTEKYTFKLEWMRRLRDYMKVSAKGKTVVVGDYNVAPTDQDVHFPEKWAGKIHCSEPERAAFFALTDAGYVDTLRALRPDEEVLTWWDYRMLAFPKNNGLRIDHILATEAVAKKVKAVDVFRDERKGQQPSDHIPVVATIA